MGLDMYLTKETCVHNYEFMEAKDRHTVTVEGPLADAVDPNNICKVTEEVAYWRKANQIHRWFVENVQEGEDDCREYLVDIEDLKKLLATVKKVLADRSKADDLLPPQLGFFYGSLEKDEYYFNALEYTRKILEKTLKKPLVGNQSYYYRASW